MAYINFQPSDYFNTKLYTGNNSSSTTTITGVGFQPDWTWTKERTAQDIMCMMLLEVLHIYYSNK